MTSATIHACPICAGDAVADTRFGGGPLSRCSSCGFTFLVSAPDVEGLYRDDYFARYMGGDYLANEAQRRRESRLRLRLLEKVTPPPARVLEIGAAAGFFLDEARRLGYEGVGIEANTTMAEHARAALALDVRAGLLEDVELPAGSIDAACAFHVLEHAPDPLRFLNAIVVSLRPGGHVLIEVPNAESTAARRLGARWTPLDLPHHVGHYGPRSLHTLLAAARLEVVLLDTVPFAIYGRASSIALAVLRARRAPSMTRQLLRAAARRPRL